MPEEILLQTLEVEVERELVGHQIYLWAPTNDDGLEWQLAELNNNKDVAGGITGWRIIWAATSCTWMWAVPRIDEHGGRSLVSVPKSCRLAAPGYCKK
jgi:hypothetical protein